MAAVSPAGPAPTTRRSYFITGLPPRSSGYGLWPLYRYDPRRREEGLNPLQLDSKAPTKSVSEFMSVENRFRMIEKQDPEHYLELLKLAQAEVDYRRSLYEYMAGEKSEAEK